MNNKTKIAVAITASFLALGAGIGIGYAIPFDSEDTPEIVKLINDADSGSLFQKVNNNEVKEVTNNYLSKTEVADKYFTKTEVAEKYILKTDPSNLFLAKADFNAKNGLYEGDASGIPATTNVRDQYIKKTDTEERIRFEGVEKSTHVVNGNKLVYGIDIGLLTDTNPKIRRYIANDFFIYDSSSKKGANDFTFRHDGGDGGVFTPNETYYLVGRTKDVVNSVLDNFYVAFRFKINANGVATIDDNTFAPGAVRAVYAVRIQDNPADVITYSFDDIVALHTTATNANNVYLDGRGSGNRALNPGFGFKPGGTFSSFSEISPLDLPFKIYSATK